MQGNSTIIRPAAALLRIARGAIRNQRRYGAIVVAGAIALLCVLNVTMAEETGASGEAHIAYLHQDTEAPSGYFFR